MDLRDRVGKIVRMKNLKRWKFEEKWKFLRRPIKEWFRIRNPSNWEWMKIWKMTILNGQTKEWCWMRNVSKLKIDENLKDENFKWPNWGMILKQMPQTRKWKKMSYFWWQNFLKKKINWTFLMMRICCENDWWWCLLTSWLVNWGDGGWLACQSFVAGFSAWSPPIEESKVE